MQPQRLVEFGNHGRWQLSKACPEARTPRDRTCSTWALDERANPVVPGFRSFLLPR
jgi:hypothetical protein